MIDTLIVTHYLQQLIVDKQENEDTSRVEETSRAGNHLAYDTSLMSAHVFRLPAVIHFIPGVFYKARARERVREGSDGTGAGSQRQYDPFARDPAM